ncbi:MAG: hypothetical protein RPU61_03210 [Candidatus Sedimenticola sp. (ex Thyasira tokunagai)]
MSKYSYEDDIKITKAELAKVQLEDAIDLFLSGKRISVITLAGAAEEIFARILNIQGDDSVAEETWRNIEEVRKETGLLFAGDRNKNDAFKEWNKYRNILKHHSKNDGDTVSFSPFDEAYEMINRAKLNADKLRITLKNRVDYENWLIENIYM